MSTNARMSSTEQQCAWVGPGWGLGGVWVGLGTGGPGCIPANCVPQPPGPAAGALGLSGTPDPVATTKTLGDPVKPSGSQVFLT